MLDGRRQNDRSPIFHQFYSYVHQKYPRYIKIYIDGYNSRVHTKCGTRVAEKSNQLSREKCEEKSSQNVFGCEGEAAW